MKEKTYTLNTMLIAVLGVSLLAAILVRTFAPIVIIPALNIPNMVALSLAALLLDHYIAPGAKRCYICVALFSALAFGCMVYAFHKGDVTMPLVLPVFMLYMPVVLYAQQLSGYLARQLRVILKKQDYQHARERMAVMGKILFYLILPVCAFLLAQANVVSAAFFDENKELTQLLQTGCIAAVFAVIFVMPLVEQWPCRISFTLEHVADVFSDKTLMGVFKNSLLSALLTAMIGTVVVYACALVSARRNTYRKFGKIPDVVSLVTNTIPGMVLGVAYLMTFKGTALHNSFAILIICNIVHFFSSPYLLIKGTLQKLNASWETTAKLMGDSWLQTVLRIITPNAASTLLEVFSYFFVNSMVTVSAVIFLVSTKSMVITAKIKELQHFASFNEIFVLSILILLTNLLVKGIVKIATKWVTKK